MSHTLKSGAARSLVLGALAAAAFAPLSQAQQIARPLSSIGTSTLAAKVSCHGITNIIELAGGIAAWEAAKLPVVTS